MSSRRVISGTFLLLLLAGCGGGGVEYDAELADAYTEVLITEIEYPSDSAAWKSALAERLKGNRYSTGESVRKEIRRIAVEDAAAFKRLLDSVYVRLDNVQKGEAE